MASPRWWDDIHHPVLFAAFWLVVGLGIGALWATTDRDAWTQLALGIGWLLVAATYLAAWRMQRRR